MTTTAPVEFDPFSAEYFDDPSEVYRRLRDEAPVYYSERYDFYALSRFYDVVAALSAPFPVEIISRMLGVPEGERQQIRHWLDLTLHREPGEMEPTAEGRQAMMDAGAYYYSLVADKRRNPGDDMLTRLTQ